MSGKLIYVAQNMERRDEEGLSILARSFSHFCAPLRDDLGEFEEVEIARNLSEAFEALQEGGVAAIVFDPSVPLGTSEIFQGVSGFGAQQIVQAIDVMGEAQANHPPFYIASPVNELDQIIGSTQMVSSHVAGVIVRDEHRIRIEPYLIDGKLNKRFQPAPRSDANDAPPEPI